MRRDLRMARKFITTEKLRYVFGTLCLPIILDKGEYIMQDINGDYWYFKLQRRQDAYTPVRNAIKINHLTSKHLTSNHIKPKNHMTKKEYRWYKRHCV